MRIITMILTEEEYEKFKTDVAEVKGLFWQGEVPDTFEEARLVVSKVQGVKNVSMHGVKP